MTDPRTILGYLQEIPLETGGNLLLMFDDPTDLDRRVTYYTVYSTNQITVTEPGQVYIGAYEPETTPFGVRVRNPERPGRAQAVNIAAGRVINNRVKASIVVYLTDKYEWAAPGDFDDAPAALLLAQSVDESRLRDESFKDAFIRVKSETLDGGAEAANRAWTALTTPRRDRDADDELEAGGRVPRAEDDDRKTKTFTADARANDTTKDPTGAIKNMEPGEFQGVEVTPDLLADYLESDYDLAWNAMLNQFRDAGTAAHFMNFLAGQFFRYRGEFLGELGQQAIEGKEPEGSFAGFLSKKGMLQGGDPAVLAGGTNDFDEFKRRLQENAAETSSEVNTDAIAATAAAEADGFLSRVIDTPEVSYHGS